MDGQVVNASDFGAALSPTSAPVDTLAALQAARDSLNSLPGTIYLPPPPQLNTEGVGFEVAYHISAPLVLNARQRLIGGNPGDVGSSQTGTVIRPTPGFSGAALLMSNTWIGGDYWHGGQIVDVGIDCAGIAAVGLAVHNFGEESLLRGVSVYDATDSDIVCTGDHAVAHFENVSVWEAGNYGIKFTQHPTLTGVDATNGGSIRLIGLSGDGNGLAHIYQDGSQKITIVGIKSERHDIGILCAGSQTGGGAAQIFLTGTFQGNVVGAEDLIKIQGTARPVITLGPVQATSFVNLINDTVQGLILPAATPALLPALITWNGFSFFNGEFVLGRELAIQGLRSSTDTKHILFFLGSDDKVHVRAAQAGGSQIEDETGAAIAKFRSQPAGGVEFATWLRWETDNQDDIGQDTFRPRNLNLAGYVQGAEIADPAAPAANGYRLFSRDNGSGKTQLCVRFATGAIQVIATEP